MLVMLAGAACREKPSETSVSQASQALSRTTVIDTASGFAAGTFEGSTELLGNRLAVSPVARSVGAFDVTTSLPAGTASHAAVVSHGFVYVLGGTGATVSAAVRRASLNAGGALGAWVADRPLPTARSGLAAVASDGFMVVTGGDGLNEVLISAIAADGSLGPWLAGPTLPSAITHHAMLVNRGFVYVLGGQLGMTPLAGVWRSELNADGTLGAWSSAGTLPAAMFDHASAIHAGSVYVAGGSDGALDRANVDRAVIAADGTLGAWVPQPALPRGRSGLSLVAHRGALVVMGGIDGVAPDVFMSTLNGNGDVTPWEIPVQQPVARTKNAAVAADGWVYSIGGFNGSASTIVEKAPLIGGPFISAWAGTSPISARTEHAVVAHRGFIYVIGGRVPTAPDTSVLMASVNGTTVSNFTATTPLPLPRTGAAAVALNNFIFVFGGLNNFGTAQATVDVAPINPDGTLGAWVAAAPSPIGRYKHGVVLEKNQVYLVGGLGSGALAEVDTAMLSFDGTVGPWSRAPDLPTPRYDAPTFAYREHLYVLGGATTSGTLTGAVSLATITDGGVVGSWVAGPALPLAMAGGSVVTHGGAVYLTGGRTTGGPQSSVLLASLKTDGQLTPWVPTSSFQNPRDSHAAVVVGDRLILLGGGSPALGDVQVGTLPHTAGLGPFVPSTPVPTARRGQGLLATDRFVYLIGGGNSMVLDDVWYAPIALDGSVGAWVQTSTLVSPRFLHSAVLYRNRIYVLGGSDGVTPTSTVQTAEIQANGSLSPWAFTTPFAGPRNELAAQAIGDHLYVAGGQAGPAFDDAQVAQLLDDGGVGPWAATTPMNRPRWGHASATYGGRFYVFGGNPDSIATSIFLQDTQSAPALSDGGLGAWSETSSFNRVRRNFSARAQDGNLILFGGVDQTGTIRDDSVETASVHADGTVGSWTWIERFAIGRRHVSTVPVGGQIYICCGVGDPGQSHYADGQTATISGPNAKAAYSLGVDLGPAANTLDTITIDGVIPSGTRVWLTTRTALASGTYGSPLTLGPVTAGAPIAIGQNARFVRMSLAIDESGSMTYDPDALSRGEISAVTLSFSDDAGPDAGVVDAGVPDAGADDAGASDAGAGVVDAGGDAGADAGGADAGAFGDSGVPDAGLVGKDAGVHGPYDLTVGCSCGSTGSGGGWVLALVLAVALRKVAHPND